MNKQYPNISFSIEADLIQNLKNIRKTTNFLLVTTGKILLVVLTQYFIRFIPFEYKFRHNSKYFQLLPFFNQKIEFFHPLSEDEQRSVVMLSALQLVVFGSAMSPPSGKLSIFHSWNR